MFCCCRREREREREREKETERETPPVRWTPRGFRRQDPLGVRAHVVVHHPVSRVPPITCGCPTTQTEGFTGFFCCLRGQGAAGSGPSRNETNKPRRKGATYGRPSCRGTCGCRSRPPSKCTVPPPPPRAQSCVPATPGSASTAGASHIVDQFYNTFWDLIT